MMKTRQVPNGIRIALVALSGFALDAAAHHGTSTFDGDTVVTLEGVVRSKNWANPHSFFVLETRGPDGLSREVELEADGPSLLRPLGVSAESLNVGDRVVAYASPSRRPGTNEYLGREIIKEDGSLVALSVRYAREQQSADLPLATSVVGTWVPDRSALFTFVAWRASWPLTSKAEAAMAAYDTTASFAHAVCVPATAPTVMVYPTAKVIEERDDRLVLNADWMGATRTIWMDGRAHPNADERFLQGHSTGRWEDGALIIDTRNFSDNPIGNAFGVPSGAGKHIVERLSLSANKASLNYDFELRDAEYLSAAVSHRFVWHFRPDISASTVECDLEAAGRYLNEN